MVRNSQTQFKRYGRSSFERIAGAFPVPDSRGDMLYTSNLIRSGQPNHLTHTAKAG